MYAFLCVGQRTAVGKKLGKLNSSVGVSSSVDVLIQRDCIRAPYLLVFLEFWVCLCAKRSQ